MIPGNHDIKRDDKTTYEINLLTGNVDNINKNIEEMPVTNYNELMKRQNNYINFYNKFLGRNYNKDKLHNFIEKEDINVIEINSCLLALSDDYGKLSIYLRKLLESLKNTNSNNQKLSIAILHHELEFLN